VTSKGQITLPKAVREVLHLDTGDRVEFAIRDDGVVELRPETGDLLALAGSLKPAKGRHASLDDMQEAIRRGGSRT
jgi:AbrB family looped-hinge helix DNA binding protein